MALTIQKHDDPGEARTGLVEVKQRLWLNADRTQVVADGDPDAAFLYALPGWSVPRDEAIRYGLVQGKGRKPAGGGDAEPPEPPAAAKLEELTVAALDALAAEHELDGYPAKGKKAEKVGFLEASGVTVPDDEDAAGGGAE
jgi:hypothetical protein